MSPNQAYVNRSLAALHNEIEFLHDSGVLSEPLYEHLQVNLPQKYNGEIFELKNNANGQLQKTDLVNPELSQTPSHQTAPSPPPYRPGDNGEKVEAMYQYNGNAPTDLPLHPGQIILILEKMNPDWWRGKDLANGREGIFPSNYVKMLPPSSSTDLKKDPSAYGSNAGYPPMNNQNYSGSTPSVYPPPPNQMAYGGGYSQGYYPQNQQSQMQASSPFPPASTNYYPPQQPEQQQQQQQPQQHQQIPEGFKKFGSKLGNAAIFGAGATMGSDLVNKIF